MNTPLTEKELNECQNTLKEVLLSRLKNGKNFKDKEKFENSVKKLTQETCEGTFEDPRLYEIDPFNNKPNVFIRIKKNIELWFRKRTNRSAKRLIPIRRDRTKKIKHKYYFSMLMDEFKYKCENYFINQNNPVDETTLGYLLNMTNSISDKKILTKKENKILYKIYIDAKNNFKR